MPFINVRTTERISAQEELVLKSRLGEAISLIPGKSERFLMVQIEEEAHLYFGGDNSEPLAFVEVKLLGKSGREDCERLCEGICNILNEELGVSPDKTYVKFEFQDTWGWNSGLF